LDVCPGGEYKYNSATVPFLGETLKLVISLFLLSEQFRKNPEAARMTRTWSSVMLFPVPSIIYWIHNNVQVRFLRKNVCESSTARHGITVLGVIRWAFVQEVRVPGAALDCTLRDCFLAPTQFFTLRYVDPATYQILGNLKIVTTGVLFRMVLKRKLSYLQWIALTLLMIGATTSQLKTDGDGSSVLNAPIEVKP
jgi:solute carrier family 35 (UDP-sugar transporter), member A1/2/3